MSNLFVKPDALFKILTEQRSIGLKLFYVGMGRSAEHSFYTRSLPSANLLNLHEFTESSPNLFTTPSPTLFNMMMKKLNILDESDVVLYNGISTAKAWFIMKYYGHPSTRILCGGIKEWNQKGYPTTSHKTPIDYTSIAHDTFTAKEPNEDMLIDYHEVLQKIGRNEVQIVDVRTEDQYCSKEHNGRGHIPGAVNIPYSQFYDKNGFMKNREEINELITLVGLDKSKETIAYCHGGVTACIGYSAFDEVGFDKLRMYDGSWAEYSSKEETREL
ncbi:unnamed protein product [Moneuplotes crassus]|uniref:Rhodanese domain-containing protein n=1 Tax=Euplotes crassus TaxID=5936 RepID=A0AAD1Y3B4_EUPCR|nr:unnamed protein product [Moneuplotes crassus]